jgi:small nuclear ribonucleoprotein E
MLTDGRIFSFEEYMNLVLDDTEEIHSKTKSREQPGQIMLKGNIGWQSGSSGRVPA